MLPLVPTPEDAAAGLLAIARWCSGVWRGVLLPSTMQCGTQGPGRAPALEEAAQGGWPRAGAVPVPAAAAGPHPGRGQR